VTINGSGLEAIPDRAELMRAFEARKDLYARLLATLEGRIREALERKSLRPIIKGRVKSFDSWYSKRIRLLRKARAQGKPPIPIADIVALRVVCPFLGDLTMAESAICASFKVMDIERKGSERSFREFGYESIHLLFELPPDLRDESLGFEIPAFEVQLRTILQEAWAEVEHELVYKADFTPFDEPMKRKLAALNANLSLSDIIFQEILDYQRRLTSALERRRSAFYGKIEDAMDKPFEIEGSGLAPLEGGGRSERRALGPDRDRILNMDELLLSALMAHNAEDYEGASRIYSDILAQEPEKDIAAVVYKHRGMAYFSQSKYKEAIEDFSSSLVLVPDDHKAAYYRGVVRSVLQDFLGAIADFDSALATNPYHFFSLYRRAMAYWHLDDFAQALADSEAALLLEPDNAQAARLKDLARRKMRM
jgi:putative GTP pyrophosphokinase